MYWLVASLIVVGGVVVGWFCAWLVHRYEEDLDSHTAVFGDGPLRPLPAPSCTPGPLAAKWAGAPNAAPGCPARGS